MKDTDGPESPDLVCAHVARPTGKTTRVARVADWSRRRLRGVGERILAFLFGDDVFVSYARLDATGYSSALADRLTQRGFACYLDQWTTQPGTDLPGELKDAIRRAGVFVLLASPAALASPWVAKEIEEFIPGRRPFLLVALTSGVESAIWFRAIRGVAKTIDTPGLAAGGPSGDVVERVVNAFGVRTRNQRLRRLFWAVLTSTALLLASAYAIGHMVVVRARSSLAEAVTNLRQTKRLADQNRAEALVAEGYSLSAAGSLEATTRLDSARRLLQSSGRPTFPADVVLWDHRRRSLALLHTFSATRERVKRLALSPDGRTLAVAEVAGQDPRRTTIHLWNARTWDDPHHLGIVDWVVASLVFSPDGRRLAAGGSGSPRTATAGDTLPRLRLWNLTAKSIVDLEFKGDVHAVAFSGDGRRMGVASGFQISVWDVGPAEPALVARPMEVPFVVSDLALGYAGAWTAAAGIGRSPIYALRWVDGPRDSAPDFPGTDRVEVIRALAVSSDPSRGDRLAWAGNGVWIGDSTRNTGNLRLLPAGEVEQLWFVEGGRRIVGLMRSPAVRLRVWSAFDGHEEYVLEDQPYEIVTATAMGTQIVAADAHGNMYVWTTMSAALRSVGRLDRATSVEAAFRLRNRALLVTGKDSGPMGLFDVATGFELPGRAGRRERGQGDGTAREPPTESPSPGSSRSAEAPWRIRAQPDLLQLWNPMRATGELYALRLNAKRHASFRAEEQDWRDTSPYPFRIGAVTVSDDGRAVSVGVESTVWILDVAVEGLRLDLGAAVRNAREALRTDPDDRGALNVTGVWLALNGVDDAALVRLRRARRAGVVVDPVILARALWRQSRRDHGPTNDVVAEFDRAIGGAADDEAREYLTLCRDAAAMRK